MIKRLMMFMLCLVSFLGIAAQSDIQTERLYLSGHGCDDMVKWDFFCTGGNHSGYWTKIGVPSCWELQGFGTYQYGMKFYGKDFPEGVANEKGLYKYKFTLPESWANRHIDLVFEASMTDTEVKINGRKAGSMHQGAFYRFIYDVSDRVFFGKKENVLEVTVSKESTNAGVNLAERRADYWNFGGIFRPVFIVAKPAVNIERTAIDAKADGTFNAYCLLNHVIEGASIKTIITDNTGKSIGENVTAVRPGSDHADISFQVLHPALWTAETPNMYHVAFTLLDKSGKALHIEKDKFGFRTIETRLHDGLYINGAKVNIRGVNRHSFRPESGRTLSKAKNIEDVLLIKSMNMNAVRLSHYPADPEFLDACDSLGLYVMNELSGWHGHHETINGKKLVYEMVTRDVNHPCVTWWSNGNEKGWNTELDGEFGKWDIQHRPVVHPQGNFGGYETMHYRSYGETEEYLRGHDIFMPTEFLHGLYDGGAGAGLYDYWELMRKAPRCAGGFIWSLVDEGVVRTDLGGIIDCQGSYAPDGIVGPHHEKEGSYYTIRQVWCPVQVFFTAPFNGQLKVENRYNFLSLKQCVFKYSYLSYSNGETTIIKQGEVNGLNIAPNSEGILNIPVISIPANALSITAIDPYGKELFTWIYKLSNVKDNATVTADNNVPVVKEGNDSLLYVMAGKCTYSFSKNSGRLNAVNIGSRTIHFANGPQFVAVRRADRSFDQFYNHDDPQAEKKKTTYTRYEDYGEFAGFSQSKAANDTLVLTANYRLGSFDKAEWRIAPDGGVRLCYTYNFNGVVDLMGVMFDYPESDVQSKRWLGCGPYRVWQNRLRGPQLGIWNNKYNDPIPSESFDYPEFKGYFAGVQWMDLQTKEGLIHIKPGTDKDYVGVYQPRDGRDEMLYTLPQTGISLLQVIPPVRNKVNTTDLIGPSSQPHWVKGTYQGEVSFNFE